MSLLPSLSPPLWVLWTFGCVESCRDLVIELECAISMSTRKPSLRNILVELLLLLIQVLLAHAHESVELSIGLQEADAFGDSVTGLLWMRYSTGLPDESLYLISRFLSVLCFLLPYLLRSCVPHLFSSCLQSPDLVFEILVNLNLLLTYVLTHKLPPAVLLNSWWLLVFVQQH